MITVQEADSLILKSVPDPTRFESIALERLHGRILAEDVLSDRGYPPFHRVAMDGIAIRAASFAEGVREFLIESTHRAGDPPVLLQDSHHCIEVMTGSVLPGGTDAVVPYEEVKISDRMARLGDASVDAWRNIHLMGSDCAEGDLLLRQGSVLDAAKLGIAASVGKSRLKTWALPRVALVSTGDELVEVDEKPLDHQIRRSNVHAVRALFATFGFDRTQLYHVGDTDPDPVARLSGILEECDFLVLSGGVSMGKFDFVPGALADLKVRRVFHKVSQRPGKPLWFGVCENNKVVFGLPGNPASALVCARRYVLPALKSFSGSVGRPLRAKLSESVTFEKRLTLFLPVRINVNESAEITAVPLQPNGSGDFASLGQSDGLIELPLERDRFEAGEAYPIYLWNGF